MSHPIYDLLDKLDETECSYVLSRHRDNSVLVSIRSVDEHIEVEVFEDGNIEISRFSGKEDMVGGLEIVCELLGKKPTDDD